LQTLLKVCEQNKSLPNPSEGGALRKLKNMRTQQLILIIKSLPFGEDRRGL